MPVQNLQPASWTRNGQSTQEYAAVFLNIYYASNTRSRRDRVQRASETSEMYRAVGNSIMSAWAIFAYFNAVSSAWKKYPKREGSLSDCLIVVLLLASS